LRIGFTAARYVSNAAVGSVGEGEGVGPVVVGDGPGLLDVTEGLAPVGDGDADALDPPGEGDPRLVSDWEEPLPQAPTVKPATTTTVRIAMASAAMLAAGGAPRRPVRRPGLRSDTTPPLP
jgi:hypothetical protein